MCTISIQVPDAPNIDLVELTSKLTAYARTLISSMSREESSVPLDILKRVNARNRNLTCPMTNEEIVSECKSAWTKVNGTK